MLIQATIEELAPRMIQRLDSGPIRARIASCDLPPHRDLTPGDLIPVSLQIEAYPRIFNIDSVEITSTTHLTSEIYAPARNPQPPNQLLTRQPSN